MNTWQRVQVAAATAATAAVATTLIWLATPHGYRMSLPVVMTGPGTLLRGVLLPKECRSCADIVTLRGDWTMSWGLANPCPASPAEFVPMCWCQPGSLTAVTPDGWLLTFNEPDNPDQCDVTPQQAAARWPALVATGRRLVSPATLVSEYATPGYLYDGWLAEFMTLIDQDTVSAVAVHYYGGHLDRLWAVTDALWLRYHKPIWLTEVGTAYQPDPAAFLTPLLAHAAEHHVDRVAVFAPRTCDWPWLPPLVTDAGLTPLGAAYAR